ncbi:MAG: hypothetical protein CMJ78_12105 [Planctomycetaceae bacterium]|nr:hypothetical protein [Planctomycetaceae bacterium]
MNWQRLQVALLLALFQAQPLFAELFIERVNPPSLVRGRVNRVSVVGTDLKQIQGLWTTVPGKAVRANFVNSIEDRTAVFDVEIDGETPIGIYGLRAATKAALSNVHLFVIDQIEATPEEEAPTRSDQASFAKAQRVNLPTAIAGVCGNADVDNFVIQVKAGQEVTFEVIGSRLGKGFDPLLTIRDSQNRIVLEHDNDVGLFFDVRKTHRFEQAGEYIVEVRDSRFRGSTEWSYLLRMGRFPEARVAVPSSVQPGSTQKLAFPQIQTAFNVTAPTPDRANYFSYEVRRESDNLATWIPMRLSGLVPTIDVEKPDDINKAKVPGSFHGVINRNGDRDIFEFEMTKGQSLIFQAESRTIGSPADLELTLTDPNGKKVKTGDDMGFEETRFTYTAKAEGTHQLMVREFVDWGGSEFAYRIDVETLGPKLTVDSGVARMAIPQGSYQPLPLTFARSFIKGNIELKLLDAPVGMVLQTNVVEPAVNELNNAISISKETSPGLYTVQVQATAVETEGKPQTLARTQPLVDRLPTGRGPHGEPFELREDQRRLPPTVTDRIAVLVLPSIPFEFHISEQLVTLPRYLDVDFTIYTSRHDGFSNPITFIARGGELNQERLRAPRVKQKFAVGTPELLEVPAKLTSAVLSQPIRHWVTLTGTSMIDGLPYTLTRRFELEVKIAFEPSTEPAKLEVAAGENLSVQLLANRLKPFGPVDVAISGPSQLTLPEMLTIPPGKKSVPLEIALDKDIKSGKYVVNLTGTARVSKLQDTASGKLEIVVK